MSAITTLIAMLALSGTSPAMDHEAALAKRVIIRNTKPVLDQISSISPRDSLRLLGFIPHASEGFAALGDTDQDGADELILNFRDNMTGFTLRIFESRPGNVYQETIQWPSYMASYAICNLDQDGKQEILGQDSYWLHVYESSSPSTHPTELVWVSPPLSNVLGSATIGDTDRDGNMEIIHSINAGTSRFIIYENKGDNNFNQAFYDAHAGQDDGRKVIADFDLDGLTEIAVSGTYGYLRIYESPATTFG